MLHHNTSDSVCNPLIQIKAEPRHAATIAWKLPHARRGIGRISMATTQGSATLDRLQDEIVNVQYREATDTFCRMMAEGNKPLKYMVKEAISAAAPFVQVPSHLMQLPTGELRGVNYDHTILGWRGAISLMGELGGKRGLLPNIQAMWYVPQGLNVWEQVICQFPGHYARDGEQCNRQFPGPDPNMNRFDGPAWKTPRVYFEEWDEPMISCIQWVSELIGIAGGDDIFAERAACPLAKDRILADSTEVLRRSPDIILGSWCGKRFRPALVAKRPLWHSLPAVAAGDLYEIKSPIILQPGPAALTDGLEAIHEVICRWVRGRAQDGNP